MSEQSKYRYCMGVCWKLCMYICGWVPGRYAINSCTGYPKDHIEKIDFQELISYFCCRQLAKFRMVWGICLYNMLHWLVCYKPAGQSFPEFGVWVSVDFDSKYKIVCGETRDHRLLYLFLKR